MKRTITAISASQNSVRATVAATKMITTAAITVSSMRVMSPRYVAAALRLVAGCPVPRAVTHAPDQPRRSSYFGHLLWNLVSKSGLTGRLDMPI